MLRVELEGAPVGGYRIRVAQRRGQREAAVVVEFGLARDERRGAVEQRHRFVQALLLVQRHAQVVQSQRVLGRECQRLAVQALGLGDVVAPMGVDALLGQRVGRLGGSSVAVLVALAAAAGARVVAALSSRLEDP